MPQYLCLADAAAVTRRTDKSIKEWIRASALEGTLSQPYEGEDGGQRPDLFYQGEAASDGPIRGKGRGYRIEAAALRRVNEARGGYKWLPDAAGSGTLAPEIAAELAELRTQNAQLVVQVERLKAQVLDSARTGLFHQTQTPRPARTSTRTSTRRALPVASFTPAPPADGADGADPERPAADTADTDISSAPAAPAGPMPSFPAHLVSVASVAKAHDIDGKNSPMWRQQVGFQPYIITGRWLITTGPWAGTMVKHALDAEGQRQFGIIFGRRANFVWCQTPGCLVCEARREAHGERLPSDVRPEGRVGLLVGVGEN